MADDQVADDQVADGQAPDDLTQGVRVCVANLTKVTDELSDAVKVKDEERAKLTEKIESLEYAASFHAVATLWGAKRLVLLAKVSGLRSETTTLFESPRRSLERVPIPSSQLRFRLDAAAGGAQQRRRERR